MKGQRLCDALNAGDGGSANASAHNLNADPEWTNDQNASDLPCWVSTDAYRRVATCDSSTLDERRPPRVCIHTRESGMTRPSRHHLALNLSAIPTITFDGPMRPMTGETGTIMPKPLPETGQFENSVVDFAAWKRLALADQQISHDEAMQLVEITGQMAKTGNAIVRTVSFVIKCLTGGRGMDSVAVKRAYEERQAELIYLDAYRDRDPNGPIAA